MLVCFDNTSEWWVSLALASNNKWKWKVQTQEGFTYRTSRATKLLSRTNAILESDELFLSWHLYNTMMQYLWVDLPEPGSYQLHLYSRTVPNHAPCSDLLLVSL